jgi:hypothetical protein
LLLIRTYPILKRSHAEIIAGFDFVVERQGLKPDTPHRWGFNPSGLRRAKALHRQKMPFPLKNHSFVDNISIDVEILKH